MQVQQAAAVRLALTPSWIQRTGGQSTLVELGFALCSCSSRSSLCRARSLKATSTNAAMLQSHHGREAKSKAPPSLREAAGQSAQLMH